MLCFQYSMQGTLKESGQTWLLLDFDFAPISVNFCRLNLWKLLFSIRLHCIVQAQWWKASKRDCWQDSNFASISVHFCCLDVSNILFSIRPHCFSRHSDGKRANVTVGSMLILLPSMWIFVVKISQTLCFQYGHIARHTDGKRANVTAGRIPFPAEPSNKVVPVLDQPEGQPMI